MFPAGRYPTVVFKSGCKSGSLEILKTLSDLTVWGKTHMLLFFLLPSPPTCILRWFWCAIRAENHKLWSLEFAASGLESWLFHLLCLTWRGNGNTSPVLLPGESHGQRSLAGHGPWRCRVGHDWSDWARTHASLGQGELLLLWPWPLCTEDWLKEGWLRGQVFDILVLAIFESLSFRDMAETICSVLRPFLSFPLALPSLKSGPQVWTPGSSSHWFIYSSSLHWQPKSSLS